MAMIIFYVQCPFWTWNIMAMHHFPFIVDIGIYDKNHKLVVKCIENNTTIPIFYYSLKTPKLNIPRWSESYVWQ